MAHERKRDQVDFLFDAEGEVFLIFIGEGADVEARARKMNSLMRAENAAHHDAAFDLIVGDLHSLQFDLAVALVKPAKFTETASSVPRIFFVVST